MSASSVRCSSCGKALVTSCTSRARSHEPDDFDGSLTVALSEWSEWDERHGRLRREVTVERGGSCRDTNRAMRPNENSMLDI
jgi:hypothetical protein